MHQRLFGAVHDQERAFDPVENARTMSMALRDFAPCSFRAKSECLSLIKHVKPACAEEPFCCGGITQKINCDAITSMVYGGRK